MSDSTMAQTADTIITQKQGQNDALKSPVHYTATDSIRFDVAEKLVYLYGSAEIQYETTTLKAPYIVIDWNTNTLSAETRPDSTGKPIKPVFKDDGEEFTASGIRYNFKSKKGKILEVITREGDGYVHGEQVKKDTSNVYYIRGGDYTTCDHEDPHFSLHASKLKVIPNDKIITGPAYLVIEHVPTPLALPFGYFPNKQGKRSGILLPTYGESKGLGFFLKDGGYYFALGKYMDLQVRGDFYSRGSWGARTSSSYRKRYRFSGRVDLGYSYLKFSDPEFPDYSLRKDFFIRWSHQQDPKARPLSRFSANVNINSGTYFRNNSYNANDVLSNEFMSSIGYSKSWNQSPFNFSMNLKHRQNTQTKVVNLSLPDMSFSMNRLNLKSRTPGKKRWYESIGISYNMNFKNDVQTYDSLMFSPSAFDNIRLGVRHSIPISASFRIGYVTISPSLTSNMRWYHQITRKTYDPDTRTVTSETINDLSAPWDYTANASMTTKIYGIKEFREKNYIRAIRHVVTPALNFSIRPDFGDSRYGYYDEVQIDSTGRTQVYSLYEQGIFGGPPNGKSGLLSLGIQNNLEMKVRPATGDTTGTPRKIKLIENLAIGTGYDLAKDSLQWSRIAMSARTSIFKNVNLTFNSVYDPYVIDTIGRNLNRLEVNENGRLGRLVNFNTGLNFGLAHHSREERNKNTTNRGTEEEREQVYRNRDGYIDFSMPWSMNVSYNLTYSKPVSEALITQSLGLTGDLKITSQWKTGFSTGYDFKNNQFTYTSVSVYRDLHCWDMSFTWIPFGFRQSYNLTIKVKSAVLQDLKLTRRRDWYDQQY
ncbi:MAG: LPS-assembly protein LptD [Flavobacteriales bacterium]|nr:LPS-assembly protein LptD [Flavobacteriales bacterium]